VATGDIRWLSGGAAAPRTEVGGKAAPLMRLAAAGVNVPRGFVVTTRAHARWLCSGDFGETAHGIRAAYRELRAHGAELVAVRSSATAEDHPDASYAGLFMTTLGVGGEDDCVAAVLRCWEAARDGAAGYRPGQAAPPEVSMAVIVQELVAADAAGVLFTVHPVTLSMEHSVVTGAFGLGELVVSGGVSPDTWVLDRATGTTVDFVIADKPVALLVRSGAVTAVELPARDRTRPSLLPEQLRELTAVGQRLERLAGHPQDIEWAYAGDRLHILQSRNITTVNEEFYTSELHACLTFAQRAQLHNQSWQRGSPMSALPVSPLYFSDMARFFAAHYDNMARIRGHVRPGAADFLFYRGWSYFNAETARWFAAMTPVSWRGPAARGYVRLQLRYPRTLGILSAARRYYRARDADWIPSLQAARPDLAAASPGELLDFVSFVERLRLRSCLVAGNGIEHCKVWLSLVERMLRRWAGLAEPGDTLAALTSGLPGGETHAETVALWQLSQLVQPGAERSGVVSGDVSGLPDSPFLRQFRVLQDELAHRGSSDRDFRHPRWGDDDNLMLGQVRAFLRVQGGQDPKSAHTRSAADREQETVRVLQRIRDRGPLGALRARLFDRALRELQVGWIFRDNQRHPFDHFLWNLRCAYRALGRRLTADGTLAEPDDVFFCGREELFAAVRGELAWAELAARAAHRKAAWPSYLSDPPALALAGTQSPGDRAAEAAAGDGSPSPQVRNGSGVLRGTGGSRGVATGLVRVVSSVASLVDLQPGEVLVTHSIDPAWSPVFAQLAGIVIEESGMLSHATVLAREYGVPAVIGLASATTLLSTGAQVTIDGSTGQVIRHQGS
jgi:rifampicin phosphotransferase